MHGVLQASVKFTKWKYMTSYVHMSHVIMHGRRGPTRCNVSKGRSTWCLAQSLPVLPDKRLWNSYLRNNLIGFDNSRCIWKPVVYSCATLYPLRHRAVVEAKARFLARPRRCYVSAITESADTTNPNLLKLPFSASWYILCVASYTSAIHTPMHAARLSHNVHQISNAAYDVDVTYEQEIILSLMH